MDAKNFFLSILFFFRKILKFPSLAMMFFKLLLLTLLKVQAKSQYLNKYISNPSKDYLSYPDYLSKLCFVF